MRVLIVGAGAIGGYFGGRMLQAGRSRASGHPGGGVLAQELAFEIG